MNLNNVKTFSFLYLPFLWISIISTSIYSATNYFVLQYISLMRESITNIFLPIAFISFAYIMFYKEKLTAIPKFKDDVFRAYVLVLLFSLPGPIFLQFAIEDLSIRWHANTKYEDIKERPGVHQFELDPPLHFDLKTVGLYPRYYRSYNKNAPDDSHHEAYIVTLVTSKNTQKPLFWFGKKYEKIVRKDRSPDSERESTYKANIENGIKSFTQSSESDSIKLLEWNRRFDDYQYFQSAVNEIPNNLNYQLPILTEIHKRKPIGYTTKASLIAFGIGQVIWGIICLFIRVDPFSLADQQELSTQEKLQERGKELLNSFSWFVPRKGYVATPIILDLNILVYLILGFLGVSMMSPSGADLIPYGSNYSPLVIEGQVWRLFTAGFLHFGFIHILMNMMAFGFCGFMLEHVLGSARFTVLYIISLLGCSLTSLYWHHPGNSAGASGAIFGLMGAMLLYAIFKIGESSNRIMFVVIFVIFGLFTLITDLVSWSHSDMAGHLGGMITGMIVAIFFIPAARKAEEINL